MLYIITQVRLKWPQKTRQMECSATLPQPAPPQPGISPTLIDGCRLTHAGANLEGYGNLGDGSGPLYASFSGPVSSRRPPNAGVATTQSRRLPKEDADQINKYGRQTDPRTNKRAKVAKWAVSKSATARAVGKKTKRVSKSDDVFDGGRRDVDERTRRDLDDSDDELY